MSKIVPHFDEFSLITQKQADYVLFKRVALMMKQGEHLTEKGLQKIINIRASMNLGLSPNLKNAFPLWKPVNRPLVENQIIPNPY